MFKDFIKKLYSKIKTTVTVTAASSVPAVAMAVDLAAGAKQDVKDTLGVGSTAWTILLVVEILAAVLAYIKTKNLALFGGIIAVILFGNVAWALIS
ncbi:hypothetical protein HEMROJRC1_20640 [Rodentibacter sp. JRC1]|uniref:hypothetical protein n=1 Tax=Rodentibacter sp. JRC1 TaxID=2874504 RepID=UPI001CFCEF7F|nr:hypothetical protein [Rodentibacter sp. JRC1]GJI56952.1 hypothetical protein HEMROJRC1_20640 [Rodentibacter sp. JRC1]